MNTQTAGILEIRARLLECFALGGSFNRQPRTTAVIRGQPRSSTVTSASQLKVQPTATSDFIHSNLAMMQPKNRTTTAATASTAVSTAAVIAAVCTAGGLLVTAPAAARDTASEIRYTDLVARLGAAVPTGAGIGVGQVEAPENADGRYAPDTTLPEFAGTTFSLLSGTGLPVSWHSTEVAKAYYGNMLSIVPGVTNVSVWNVNPWLTTAYLRVGQGSAVAPANPPTGVKVFNHSWIGSFGNTTNDNDALRRLDFAIHRDNIFVAAGTNNGAASAASPMLAYAYNAVTVGLPNGAHSNGLTPVGIDGQNRRKPDIVAPGQFTSFATPVVGAAAALLFDAADSDPAISGNVNANKALTIRASIFAGANHRLGWSNGTPNSGALKGITATPLDPLYGVDLLDIDRAHRVFTAGEVNGTAAADPTTFRAHQGWDYATTVASNTSLFWSFRVHTPINELSAIASWNRQVATSYTSTSVQDFDLKLWKVVAGSLSSISGSAGAGVYASGNVESNSLVDNVEHLYLRDLAAGDYVLELKRKTGTQISYPVVVAWYMPNTVATNPADLNGDGSVGAADLSTLLSQWGGPGSGDLDGDGSVGASDLSTLLGSWG